MGFRCESRRCREDETGESKEGMSKCNESRKGPIDKIVTFEETSTLEQVESSKRVVGGSMDTQVLVAPSHSRQPGSRYWSVHSPVIRTIETRHM